MCCNGTSDSKRPNRDPQEKHPQFVNRKATPDGPNCTSPANTIFSADEKNHAMQAFVTLTFLP